jgi:hypothetical protein
MLGQATAGEYQRAFGPLITRWADDVTPEKVHREYPRPQMVRDDWMNLNGMWDLAIVAKDAPKPETFDTQILVPFPVESALSGVMKPVSESQRIWYHRTFRIPKNWVGNRILLHFGAVDFETLVWVNGQRVGHHRGGYDAFTCEISDQLNLAGENELVVAVLDPTDAGTQPRGKQVRRPGGIWYTPTSGIWQTVWLEPVPAAYIEGLKITPDVDASSVLVRPTIPVALANYTLHASIHDRTGKISETAGAPGKELVLKIEKPKLWSPEKPYLYDLVVRLKLGERTIDEVKSYVGMRKISLGKDAKGFTRLMLNNEPYFQLGPLDQGFWPDGLYTAPTDEALRYDIEMTKKLGFNMARKHVKVEPDRWYYWCDKLGLLVWQDMPSGDKYIGARDPDITRSPESAKQFETELRRLVEGMGNHPCIVMWVPYNEGWGQWDTPRIVDMIKSLDPSRLVNNASGWTDRKVGDVNDMHNYPGPGAPDPEPNRAAVLGEFGGLGLPIRGRTWQTERNWGYRSFADSTALTSAYVDLLARLYPLIETKGLSAAVYTQTADVEVEVNGLMTYDRAVVKMDIKQVADANRGKFPPRPKVTEVVPTAQTARPVWRYSLEKPGADWARPGFDDGSWKQGTAGFGTRGTPGSIVRTEWKTGEIWLRREFSIPDMKTGDLKLLLHHDEDAEVYVNGVLATSAPGFSSDYQGFNLTPEGKAALKPSGNILAVHCRQTTGGQYIDAGIARIEPPSK